MMHRLIIKILFGLEVKEMAVVYATLILKGKKNIEDVPARIRDEVKQVLIDLDLESLAI
nr:CD1375 family protein [Parablautia sp. Marseille-Q6255]